MNKLTSIKFELPPPNINGVVNPLASYSYVSNTILDYLNTRKTRSISLFGFAYFSVPETNIGIIGDSSQHPQYVEIIKTIYERDDDDEVIGDLDYPYWTNTLMLPLNSDSIPISFIEEEDELWLTSEESFEYMIELFNCLSNMGYAKNILSQDKRL